MDHYKMPNYTNKMVSNDEKRISRLSSSDEVEQIANNINIFNREQILLYGNEHAEKVSRFSNEILTSISNVNIERSNELMERLELIMTEFNSKDLTMKNHSKITAFFNRIFKRDEKFAYKYLTFSKKIHKIYIEIAKLEKQLQLTTKRLDNLFKENNDCTKTIIKLITAGEIKLAKIKNEGDTTSEIRRKNELDGNLVEPKLINNVQLFEGRLGNLVILKNISKQIAEQIKIIMVGNEELLNNLNTAFIVTIPLFQQRLSDIIKVRQQLLVSKSLQKLQDRVRTNVESTAKYNEIQSNLTKEHKQKYIFNDKIEIIEKDYDAIVAGIKNSKLLINENRNNYLVGTVQLEQLKIKIENILKEYLQ